MNGVDGCSLQVRYAQFSTLVKKTKAAGSSHADEELMRALCHRKSKYGCPSFIVITVSGTGANVARTN